MTSSSHFVEPSRKGSCRGCAVVAGICLAIAAAAVYWIVSGLMPDRAGDRNGPLLVEAIYAFRAQHGLWPEYLEDALEGNAALVKMAGEHYARPNSRHDSTYSSGDWCYSWNGGNGFRLHRVRVWYADEAPTYRVSRADEDWIVHATPEFEVLPVAERSHVPLPKAMAAEFRHRIAREPKYLIHRQGFITALVNAGDLPEALSQAQTCLRDFPEHWWPTLVVAWLEEVLHPKGHALMRSRQSTLATPALQKALEYLRSGDLPSAGEELKREGQLIYQEYQTRNIIYLPSADAYALTHLYLLALHLYESGQHPLVLASLEQCQRFGGYACCHALLAACHARLGQREEAADALASVSTPAFGLTPAWQEWIEQSRQRLTQGETLTLPATLFFRDAGLPIRYE